MERIFKNAMEGFLPPSVEVLILQRALKLLPPPLLFPEQFLVSYCST